MQKTPGAGTGAYVSTSTAAVLLDMPHRTAQIKAQKGEIAATQQPVGRGGKSGTSYLIDTRDLPIEAQLRWQAMPSVSSW